MARTPNSSGQTRLLLQALLARADDWRHGYDLSKETGLKSGTLYPILVRLEAQGWLDTRWEDAQALGRPPRHLYRLTTQGQAEASALLVAAASRNPGLPVTLAGEAGAR